MPNKGESNASCEFAAIERLLKKHPHTVHHLVTAFTNLQPNKTYIEK